MNFLLVGLIKIYRYLISPLMGQNCRFHPTCSSYAIEALNKHGVLKGIWLGTARILKCHPWYRGEMLDSVPDSIAWGQLIGYKRRHSDKQQNN